MGQPAARITDMTACPMVAPGPVPHVGGPLVPPCCPTVIVGGSPQARVGDMAICAAGGPDAIARGSTTVWVGGSPAARLGDQMSHGGALVTGCATVLIGDATGGGAGVTAGVARTGPQSPAQVPDADLIYDPPIEPALSPLDFIGPGILKGFAALGRGLLGLGVNATRALPAVLRAEAKAILSTQSLKPAQLSNYKRFIDKIPSNAKNTAIIEQLERGMLRFQATSAGRVPGSRAVYTKVTDAAGETTEF